MVRARELEDSISGRASLAWGVLRTEQNVPIHVLLKLEIPPMFHDINVNVASKLISKSSVHSRHYIEVIWFVLWSDFPVSDQEIDEN